MTRPRRPRGPSVQSPLETYLREINETALLTADEEKDLAHRIEAGDGEARDRMVRANLRLVVNIARSYAGKGLSLQDLIEEGNLGLLRAAEGFDPSMNIRIPTYMVELLSKWRRTAAQLQDKLGRPPTPEEIGRVLGLPKRQLAIIKKAIRISSVSPQTDQADVGWSMDEMVLDSRTRRPDLELGEAD